MEEKPKDKNGKELEIGQKVKARMGNPLYYEAGVIVGVNPVSSSLQTHDGISHQKPNTEIEIMEI